MLVNKLRFVPRPSQSDCLVVSRPQDPHRSERPTPPTMEKKKSFSKSSGSNLIKLTAQIFTIEQLVPIPDATQAYVKIKVGPSKAKTNRYIHMRWRSPVRSIDMLQPCKVTNKRTISPGLHWSGVE